MNRAGFVMGEVRNKKDRFTFDLQLRTSGARLVQELAPNINK